MALTKYFTDEIQEDCVTKASRTAPRSADTRHSPRNRTRKGPARGGQDPTRQAPGGSRTETKIAKESALGSDGGSTDAKQN